MILPNYFLSILKLVILGGGKIDEESGISVARKTLQFIQ
jgi:hypothetical protein